MKKDISIIIFQVIYTLNIFNQLKLMHQDLHISNVLIQKSNVITDYYYVLMNKIVHTKTNMMACIYDFDRATNQTCHMRFPWSNNNDSIKQKLDLKFFMTNMFNYCERNDILKNKFQRFINKIFYNKSNDTNRMPSALDSNPITWISEPKENYDAS